MPSPVLSRLHLLDKEWDDVRLPRARVDLPFGAGWISTVRGVGRRLRP